MALTPRLLKNKHYDYKIETDWYRKKKKKANVNSGELNPSLSYFWIYFKFGNVQNFAIFVLSLVVQKGT